MPSQSHTFTVGKKTEVGQASQGEKPIAPIIAARKRYDGAAPISFDELARIQGYRAEDAPGELPVEGWKHLVARRHPWRRQLFIKGRNMTVRQLIGTVKVENWNDGRAAQALDLPEETIAEARQYAELNQELLARS